MLAQYACYKASEIGKRENKAKLERAAAEQTDRTTMRCALYMGAKVLRAIVLAEATPKFGAEVSFSSFCFGEDRRLCLWVTLFGKNCEGTKRRYVNRFLSLKAFLVERLADTRLFSAFRFGSCPCRGQCSDQLPLTTQAAPRKVWSAESRDERRNEESKVTGHNGVIGSV